MGDTHHQQPTITTATQTHTAPLARCCPCRPCLCPTQSPMALPYPTVRSLSVDNVVLRRISYTCLACPVPAMLVDVGPTPPCGRCLLPSTWYVAHYRGRWRQRLLHAPDVELVRKVGGGREQGLKVAPGGLYTQLPRALCVTRVRENGGGGPAMRQRAARCIPVYCTNISPAALCGQVACDFDGRANAVSLRLPTSCLWMYGAPSFFLFPLGHDRQLVAAARLKGGPYLTRGGCEV